jgi:hypothetical protein
LPNSFVFETKASLGFAIAGLATGSIGFGFSGLLELSAALAAENKSIRKAEAIARLAARRFFIRDNLLNE